MLKYSLLTESVFRVTRADGTADRLTLPGVMTHLSAGENLTFPSLRPHQAGPFHSFLVLLGYLALEQYADPLLPSTSDTWLALLRALTPRYQHDEPWHLVNTDWLQPAFLQPPCGATRKGDFKHRTLAAQDMDLLATSSHHDEKAGKLPLSDGESDVTAFALIAMQGSSPYGGSGNAGSMRMNGGFSSRPQFRMAFERGTGAEFRRDLMVLRQRGGEIAEAFFQRHGKYPDETLRLLWLMPWDDEPLALSDVHPLCLEVCRRGRLTEDGEHLVLMRATSRGMRVDAKSACGDVLDPWVPIVLDNPPKALTAQHHSLGYRKLQELIFDRTACALPLLGQASDAERRAGRPGTLIAQVLVSGNCRTDGFIRRELPMPLPILARFNESPQALALRSRHFVDLAGVVSGKVLRPALLQFMAGIDDVDSKNRDMARAVTPWLDRFEAAVDEHFFGHLFDSIERGDDDTLAQRQWVVFLGGLARGHLDEAAESLPTRDRSRLFAGVHAHRRFERCLRKQLGNLLEPSKPTAHLPQPEESPHG